jgi:hypothetical protein
MNIVDKHEPREYTAMMHDGGIVLCDKQEGAFLLLRFASDLERLKELLGQITMVEAELASKEVEDGRPADNI